MQKIYTNACIYTGTDVIIPQGYVLVSDSKIEAVGEGPAPVIPGAEIISCEGRSLAPGLIDLQIYGGQGKLFNNEPTAETIRSTWQAVQAGGGAWFQITLSCTPLPVMWQAIEACREYWAAGGEGLLGLHLEGPYFNPEKRGAHPLQHIRKANPAEIAELLERGKGVVTYMTLAPEMVDEVSLKMLLESGIIIAAGHSNATFTEAVKGFEAGIGHATHLFNAMSPLQSRAPGMVGAIYDQKPWTSVIADGIHIDYNALKVSKQILQHKLFLITDAVTESLLGDYRFRFSGDRFTDEQGTLAGSALTMQQAIQNAVQYAGIDRAEALRMASTWPAAAAGLGDRLGKIAPGYDAKMFLFQDK
jgi:N-acetylglucosamine-6-phosphate deacetylase